MGLKLTRWPRRKATAWASSRVMTASSAARTPVAGALPEYPIIAGQNEKYLVNALKAYKSGRRTGTYAALMAATANNLSDADIENLAAYLAGLDDSK